MQKTERKTQKTGRKVHILEVGSSAPTATNHHEPHRPTGGHITTATTPTHIEGAAAPVESTPGHIDNPATPTATTSPRRQPSGHEPAAHI